jgi:hypothetical protein
LSSTYLRALIAASAAGAALAAAGCGSGSTEPTKVSMSISEQGKAASFKAPKTATGGLVDLSFKNGGKAPHGVQLIQYTGNHTVDDVLTQLGKNTDKVPEWLRAQGGTPAIPGGQSDSATLNLPEGNYAVIDSAALGGGSGPPANAAMKFTSGDTGDLPSTPATVKAASIGKDKFAWDISGLKAGKNRITFDSEGSDALHFIIATPVNGKAPSIGKIKQDLGKAGSGPPPAYLDFQDAQSSAVLDGGTSQTTSLELRKPGQYIFFCPLTDRDGGKTHDQEGLLKVVTVK